MHGAGILKQTRKMLLKGEPKVSTCASREWFSQKDQCKVYSSKATVLQNLVYTKLIFIINLCLTNDFSELYEMKTLFFSLEYFGANYSRTSLQPKK